ncbi:hypothetical protein EVAR_11221_1 [Eumeta japonica]|uniref:Uncharacterized protein n=1 Tax=Eumeta variegata TaxID=151549 RepID=A0A4C1ZWZ2_EUMVA|nr:hypothetical protein EVAR_11221_1 [Eumeta japonica]
MNVWTTPLVRFDHKTTTAVRDGIRRRVICLSRRNSYENWNKVLERNADVPPSTPLRARADDAELKNS